MWALLGASWAAGVHGSLVYPTWKFLLEPPHCHDSTHGGESSPRCVLTPFHEALLWQSSDSTIKLSINFHLSIDFHDVSHILRTISPSLSVPLLLSLPFEAEPRAVPGEARLICSHEEMEVRARIKPVGVNDAAIANSQKARPSVCKKGSSESFFWGCLHLTRLSGRLRPYGLAEGGRGGRGRKEMVRVLAMREGQGEREDGSGSYWPRGKISLTESLTCLKGHLAVCL